MRNQIKLFHSESRQMNNQSTDELVMVVCHKKENYNWTLTNQAERRLQNTQGGSEIKKFICTVPFPK